MINAVCVLRNMDGAVRGGVTLQEIEKNGPVKIYVYIEGLTPGNHGFHIHATGDTTEGSKTLCAHFNPLNKEHGGRNDTEAHLGDLGNVYANNNGIVDETFIAEFIRLRGTFSVLGRSFIVHQDEDDLGLGDYQDSKTTGHSGKRVLWGVIGFANNC